MIAAEPDSYYTKRTQLIADLLEAVVPATRSLDVGCGAGLLSYELWQRGYDVYGTDIADSMVASARERLAGLCDTPESRFRPAPCGHIPFDGTFGLITVVGVFPYVLDYGGYLSVLRSRLAPGGYLLCSCTNRVSLYTGVLLLQHLRRPNRSAEWRAVLVNLIRTGLWSGGYVEYAQARQCYSAHDFDGLLKGFELELIESIDLYNLAWLDRRPLSRGALGKRISRLLGWNHIGLYRKRG